MIYFLFVKTRIYCEQNAISDMLFLSGSGSLTGAFNSGVKFHQYRASQHCSSSLDL